MLRIEDTDAERSKTEFEIELIKGLHWLGLEWDEGPDYIDGTLISKGSFSPYRQSERQDIYKKYVDQLLSEKKAYYCYCTKEELEAQQQVLLASGLPPKYNGHCRNLTAPPPDRTSKVIRFKTPEIKVGFKDLIRGKVEFDASLIGDMIITRSDGTVLYNLAVVIDDHAMKITHVIRGEDHIANTPKQILFQQALGFSEPIYAHLPLILNADKTKFSKRKNKASLLEYQKDGYLPEAIINFLALLGWHPSDDREVMNLNELISEFDLERVQKAGAVFDEDKLDLLNREHMKTYSNADLAKMVKPFIENKFGGLLPGSPASNDTFIERLVAVERTRANTLSDFAEVGAFFFKVPNYEPRLLIWKEAPLKEVKAVLEKAYAALDELSPDSFVHEPLSTKIVALIGESNRGTVLWPLRVALSGQQSSPDPIDIMEVLGKKESLARIEAAIKMLTQ